MPEETAKKQIRAGTRTSKKRAEKMQKGYKEADRPTEKSRSGQN